MTRADIVKELKNMIGPAVEIDDTGLAQWVNDSYLYMVQEIAKQNPDFFTKDATAPTLAGQEQYDLPADFVQALMVNIQQAGQWYRVRPLPEITKIPVYQNSDSFNGYTLSNAAYYIFSNQIGFVPVPTDSNGIVKLWYVYAPAELTDDTSVPAFPATFHHLVKYGAYANYLDQDDEHQAAEVMRNRFEKRVADMVEALEANEVDEPKSVEITGSLDLYYDNDRSV